MGRVQLRGHRMDGKETLIRLFLKLFHLPCHRAISLDGLIFK